MWYFNNTTPCVMITTIKLILLDLIYLKFCFEFLHLCL